MEMLQYLEALLPTPVTLATLGWAPTHVSANPEHGLELLQLAVSVKSSNYANSCEL